MGAPSNIKALNEVLIGMNGKHRVSYSSTNDPFRMSPLTLYTFEKLAEFEDFQSSPRKDGNARLQLAMAVQAGKEMVEI